MIRTARALLSCTIAAAVVLAPTAALASDQNVVIAVNSTDGAAVVEASVQYRTVPNGVVDEVNVADARARCHDCQTLAAAFQLVLVTREMDTLAPRNRAFALNVLCEECLTWASAKQVIVATGGPAALTDGGHLRMQLLEDRLEALEADLPALSLAALLSELDAAYAELVDIAQTEVMYLDGAPADVEIAAAHSA